MPTNNQNQKMTSHNRWTEQEDATLRQLVSSGTPRSQIAEVLGRNLPATYTRISTLGLGSSSPAKKKMSEAAKLRSVLNTDRNMEEIARTLNISQEEAILTKQAYLEKEKSITQRFDKAYIIGHKKAPIVLSSKSLSIIQKDLSPESENGRRTIKELLQLGKVLGKKHPYYKSFGDLARICLHNMLGKRIKFEDTLPETGLSQALQQEATLTAKKQLKEKATKKPSPKNRDYKDCAETKLPLIHTYA